jgi:glutathione synthase
MRPDRPILVVADALSGFATYKDTTFAMIRELRKRGVTIHTAEIHELAATAKEGLSVHSRAIDLQDHLQDLPDQPWWKEEAAQWRPITAFSAVLMRKDPPFDHDYFVATQLLDLAVRHGVPVINHPRSLRDHGEKMAALEFPEFTPPTLIASDMASIKAFAASQGKVVLKPLDAMGGTGIFVLSATDPNLPSAIEILSSHGRQAIVAQGYIPEIVQGDKRIIVINGKPIDFALARIPPEGQSRGNLAAGGKGVAVALTDRDREIAETVGAKLLARGLTLLGLDVIGDYLTEINVTSPTGFQEISQQTGIDVAAIFVDAVFAQIRSFQPVSHVTS